jgi:hypothetical protein
VQKHKFVRLLLVCGSLLVAGATCAQSAPGSINDYLKQGGLIDDSKVDPMPFASASQGLELLAKSSAYRADDSHAARGLVRYEPLNHSGPGYDYMALVKGSPFYPSVVRSKLVNAPGHLEIHRAILCGASPLQCDALREMFNHMDAKCGKAIKGCPGYQTAESAGILIPPPPPPPPPLPKSGP